MTWILLEGLDRSGKSSVAEMYKKQGYDVVHMSAPDKKYQQPGYSGPSYLEEIVHMYTIYESKDVVFDRTVYGECVWPEVYNRQAQLNAEDLEYLQRLEYNNNAIRYIMYDENTEAHWQRCVDNQEPLNRLQFVQASRLYDDLARKYNFQKKQLGDFDELDKEDSSSVGGLSDSAVDAADVSVPGNLRQDTDKEDSSRGDQVDGKLLARKLERANAIRDLLETKIVKKKGEIFGQLEQDIKVFLESELNSIFTQSTKLDFTPDEVQILKIYAQRIKDKLG
jgi:hypothetical protein